jgi:hypothetical protein
MFKKIITITCLLVATGCLYGMNSNVSPPCGNDKLLEQLALDGVEDNDLKSKRFSIIELLKKYSIFAQLVRVAKTIDDIHVDHYGN